MWLDDEYTDNSELIDFDPAIKGGSWVINQLMLGKKLPQILSEVEQQVDRFETALRRENKLAANYQRREKLYKRILKENNQVKKALFILSLSLKGGKMARFEKKAYRETASKILGLKLYLVEFNLYLRAVRCSIIVSDGYTISQKKRLLRRPLPKNLNMNS